MNRTRPWRLVALIIGAVALLAVFVPPPAHTLARTPPAHSAGR